MTRCFQRLIEAAVCGTLIAALAPAACRAGDILYQITDLGTLGGNYIYVSGINGSGQVVGNATTNGGNGMNAFIYSAGAPLDLGTLGGTNLQILLTSSNYVQLQFTAQANSGYVLEYRDSLTSGTWQPLVVLDPIPSVHMVLLLEPLDPATPMRFYRVSGSAPQLTSPPVEGVIGPNLASLDWTHIGEAAALGVDATFNNALNEAVQVRAGTPLSAEQATLLACQLANEQAQPIYHCQPFRVRHLARWTGERWFWRQRQGYGQLDIEATVGFDANGANPEVGLSILDSRVR